MKDALEQTVFVVDDDAAVRDSIMELLESVGLQAECFASAIAFLDAFQSDRAGCLVADVRMAEMSGLALQEKLVELEIRIPVFVITGHGDVPMAVQAMKNGAIDFIQKPYREQALLDAINVALARDEAARRSIDASEDIERHLADLTEREQEVLDKILAGMTSKEIARDLDVSPRTVEAHRSNMLRKLGVGTVKELMLRLNSLV